MDSGTPGQALPVTAVHVARTLDATNDRLEASTLYFDRPDSTDKIDFNQSPEDGGCQCPRQGGQRSGS